MMRPGTLAETTVSSSPKSVPTTSTVRWTGRTFTGARVTGTVEGVRAPAPAAWDLRSQAVRVVAAVAAAVVNRAVVRGRVNMAIGWSGSLRIRRVDPPAGRPTILTGRFWSIGIVPPTGEVV